ncbi:cytochrome c family protein [Archangium minus]|uniref:Cytochrome c family protein n=1 Tax=Archangium minus TaxID=83450 RepID=A0ABY9WZV3_9BACT|nr:cytochrome c family protein [Archangium minus]
MLPLPSPLGRLMLPGLLALGACVSRPSIQEPAGTEARTEPPVATASPASAPAPRFSCSGTQNIQFGPNIPPDVSRVTSQLDANCFAWSEFISLNWPAAAILPDGGTSDAFFGSPGDLGAVQWQTFMSTEQLFLPDGGTPPPWGTPSRISEDCLAEANVSPEQARTMLALNVVSKFETQFSSGSGNQAFPRDLPAWLGASHGTNVWYEVRISEPEYTYIVDAGLYNAANQLALVDGGAGSPIVNPMGSWQPNTIGALELKAAWMEVPNPEDSRWKAYKLSQAVVVEPTTQKCRATTVALVGLHIIHKTATQRTWVWATFEHVNNAPDQGADAGTTSWNFYDPQCKPRTIELDKSCSVDGGTSVTVGCTPNEPPPYWLGGGCPAPVPIQVTRVTPIESTAKDANQTVQTAIAQNYPDSVWKNYVLVNTLWSTAPSPNPTKPVKVPLPFAGATPSINIPIANTTMETYIQTGSPDNASNCINCHRNASIAGDSGWASDFSFVYGLASAPPPPGKPLKLRSAAPGKPQKVVFPPTMRRILR